MLKLALPLLSVRNICFKTLSFHLSVTWTRVHRNSIDNLRAPTSRPQKKWHLKQGGGSIHPRLVLRPSTSKLLNYLHLQCQLIIPGKPLNFCDLSDRVVNISSSLLTFLVLSYSSDSLRYGWIVWGIRHLVPESSNQTKHSHPLTPITWRYLIFGVWNLCHLAKFSKLNWFVVLIVFRRLFFRAYSK